jgi:hypothetical protein
MIYLCISCCFVRCQFLKFVAEDPDFFLDTKELEQENPEIPGNPIIFGPRFMAQRLYQLSPPEVREKTGYFRNGKKGSPKLLFLLQDLTLALSLVRLANRFIEDALMRDEKLLTEEGYGSVRRVFVLVEDDLGLPTEFQKRMVAQSPGVVVVEAMAAADHMAMLSRPRELVELLVRIANKCSE